MTKDQNTLTGGCYCKALRYEITADPVFRAQCHCRECQYISGGGPNYFMIVPGAGFTYTKGTPSQFTRSDIENPRTRDFCGNCGTHIVTHLPGRDTPVVKVGTLDDPAAYGGPSAAIFTIDMQPFHVLPDGLPSFERVPPRS